MIQSLTRLRSLHSPSAWRRQQILPCFVWTTCRWLLSCSWSTCGLKWRQFVHTAELSITSADCAIVFVCASSRWHTRGINSTSNITLIHTDIDTAIHPHVRARDKQWFSVPTPFSAEFWLIMTREAVSDMVASLPISCMWTIIRKLVYSCYQNQRQSTQWRCN